jgi:creatinine amidohydrolase
MLNHMFSMNREQFKALMEKTDLAFLPVSPMEAHGPHLPLGSDVLTACQMCDDAARKLQDEGIESLIAAPINYCLADVASCFPGTVTIRAETVTALVEDVCTSLASRGFKKILLSADMPSLQIWKPSFREEKMSGKNIPTLNISSRSGSQRGFL